MSPPFKRHMDLPINIRVLRAVLFLMSPRCSAFTIDNQCRYLRHPCQNTKPDEDDWSDARLEAVPERTMHETKMLVNCIEFGYCVRLNTLTILAIIRTGPNKNITRKDKRAFFCDFQ